MRTVLPLLACALALLALDADAAPSRAKIRPEKVNDVAGLFGGQPSKEPGKLGRKAMGLPSAAQRSAALADIDAGASTTPVAWAAISPRNPYEPNKGALVFSGPNAVDTRRGIAMWGISGSGSGSSSNGGVDVGDFLCELLGCPGTSAASARALQVWVNASASKKYSAVCRIRLDDKVGDMIIETDDATTTKHIDHTGKSSATVSFFLDPGDAGWYGFTVRSDDAWSTSGCTIDELQ